MNRLILLFCFMISLTATAQVTDRDYYEIKVYHYSTSEQEKILDEYLMESYLPAIRKEGFSDIGVFKDLANDTSSSKKLFIIVNTRISGKLFNLTQIVEENTRLANSRYTNAKFNALPYDRIETIWLKAFSHHPLLKKPTLKSERSSSIYELRSYESGTEKLYRTKVEMFNEGGEIDIFERLGFNAVFYGEVLAGSRMPNLMYMTSFENIDQRNKHWDTFRADAGWKALLGQSKYDNTVSKSNIWLLKATSYSDY